MLYVIGTNGNSIDFEAATELMDDEIREAIHAELAPCTAQEFFDEYQRRHLDKYGEEFTI